MAALTSNRPLRDLAVVILAGVLAFGAVRACSENDDGTDAPTGETVEDIDAESDS